MTRTSSRSRVKLGAGPAISNSVSSVFKEMRRHLRVSGNCLAERPYHEPHPDPRLRPCFDRRDGRGREGRKGQLAITGVEPAIAIERRDDLDHRRRRAQLAALELGIERAKHLAQPRDLDVGVAVGGVESPFADRPVDPPPHAGGADLQDLGDLMGRPARGEKGEAGLAPLVLLQPPRLRRRPRFRPRGWRGRRRSVGSRKLGVGKVVGQGLPLGRIIGSPNRH